jgi:DNA-binding MarR family transcriptional regulator
MSERSKQTARKFLETIPTVMRAMGAQARRGDHNIAPNHFRILHILSMKECNLSQLAESQAVSLPSMSVTAQTLVERGWLQRVRSQGDRRMVELQVTDEGRRVLGEEHERLLDWMAARLEPVAQDELETLERGLQTLLDLFAEERANLHADAIGQKL